MNLNIIRKSLLTIVGFTQCLSALAGPKRERQEDDRPNYMLTLGELNAREQDDEFEWQGTGPLTAEDCDLVFQPDYIEGRFFDWSKGHYLKQADLLAQPESTQKRQRSGYMLMLDDEENLVFANQLLAKNKRHSDKRAFAIISELASKGSKDGQFALAKLYQQGTAIPKNIDLAIHWFKEAANNYHAQACTYLGDLFINSVNIENHHSLAFNYYYKAAALDNFIAMIKLGHLYRYGHVVRRQKIALNPVNPDLDFVVSLQDFTIIDQDIAVDFYMMACRTDPKGFMNFLNSRNGRELNLLAYLNAALPKMNTEDAVLFKLACSPSD